MTRREREIIDILKKEPMISQNELAGRLGIARSSVAVHITNLMKKGIIAGKGYVIREDRFVAVLGGANVDILGFPESSYKAEDSNPGTVMQTPGGVGRNIAENLARLNVPVRLLTLVGEDMNGDILLTQTKEAGVDVSAVGRVRDHATGVYLSVQDEHGEVVSAINQMSIYDKMDESYPESVLGTLEQASAIVVDTNISQMALSYVTRKLPKARFFLDPVSSRKALRARDIIGSFYAIKPNRMESEMLTGIPITGPESLKDNAAWFLERGVKHVCISMGSEGTFVASDKVMGRVTSTQVQVRNANGAGDAFMAALVRSSLDSEDTREWGVEGAAASIAAILSEETINQELSVEKIQEIIKEYQIQWKDL